ncbi:low temperature requirement protein A [Peribacillus frigoritolerans]|nr:low temperature requirement protein A [Peribacillus frigoritolerans]
MAAVAGATHVLLHVEDGYIHPEYLLKFVLIFIPIWWAWVGQTIFINRFGKGCISSTAIFDIANVFLS